MEKVKVLYAGFGEDIPKRVLERHFRRDMVTGKPFLAYNGYVRVYREDEDGYHVHPCVGQVEKPERWQYMTYSSDVFFLKNSQTEWRASDHA